MDKEAGTRIGEHSTTPVVPPLANSQTDYSAAIDKLLANQVTANQLPKPTVSERLTKAAINGGALGLFLAFLFGSFKFIREIQRIRKSRGYWFSYRARVLIAINAMWIILVCFTRYGFNPDWMTDLLYLNEERFYYLLFGPLVVGSIGYFLWGWVKNVPKQTDRSPQSILRSQRLENDDYGWENRELGLYFKAQPSDPVWKAVTPQVAELIQQGFLEIWQRAGLEKYSDTNSLPPGIIDIIAEVANKVGEPNNLNPALVILVTHQYVDADRLMRQMYRTRWVAFMVSRDSCAPSPESYHEYILSRYFPGKE